MTPFDPRPFVSKIPLLTGWQFMCLIGISSGRTHKEMADAWGKAERTVSDHCRALRVTLGITGRETMAAQLTRISIAAGLVD